MPKQRLGTPTNKFEQGFDFILFDFDGMSTPTNKFEQGFCIVLVLKSD